MSSASGLTRHGSEIAGLSKFCQNGIRSFIPHWLSPPVAQSAYFLKGVVPDWDLAYLYKGMMQFMEVQLIGLTLIILFPQIELWLPEVMNQ